MPIVIECPHCGKSLRVPDAMAGNRGKCPSCGQILTIEQTATQEAPVQPAPAPVQPRPEMAALPDAPPRFVFSGVVYPPDTFSNLFTWMVVSFLLYVVVGVASLFVWIITLETTSRRANQRVVEVDPRGNVVSRRNADPDVDPAVILTFVAMLLLVLGLAAAQTVVFCMFVYKAWNLIQDGNARTTPGQAVGFMFIPFFNLYWMFVALRGLCEDLNGYGQEHGMAIRQASVDMMTGALVCLLATVLPCVGWMVYIPAIILYILALNSVKNAAIDITEAKAAARPV